MELNNLTNTPGARKGKKRVGRGCGSGLGKTSGKGQKGQQSRKGHKHKLQFEGGQMPLVRRLPKRGFNNARFNDKALAVNVSDLEKKFEAGAEITVEALRKAGFTDNILYKDEPFILIHSSKNAKLLSLDDLKIWKRARK